ncbi:hypothetical protein SAMN05216334_10791 [Nitrosomonas ureae]|uniref:Uncharacterized protein n=1 Tax=Nitrosomonas ureae TaxID=44577 RepID=A0A1H5UCN1_9PROT|nr:hypothetical protein SAMN05216334_10791 [Nitrosomonas ureae]
MELPRTQYSQKSREQSVKFFKESGLTVVEAEKRLSWSLLPWNGWIGSTIAGYWSRSEIFHQWNLKWHIIGN